MVRIPFRCPQGKQSDQEANGEVEPVFADFFLMVNGLSDPCNSEPEDPNSLATYRVVKAKIFLVLLFVVLLGAGLAWWWPASKPVPEALPESELTQTAKAAATGSSAHRIIRAIPGENRPVSTETAGTQIAAVEASPVVSKVERLEQIRANFNTLAGGNAKTALAAAHQIKG